MQPLSASGEPWFRSYTGAVRYGLDDVNVYITKTSVDMIRCVQIESFTEVKNLPEMSKNPYVDCFIFGPCDLSGSIGEFNWVFDKNTSDLINETVAVLKAAGKSIGVSYRHQRPRGDQILVRKGNQRDFRRYRLSAYP